MRLGFGCDFGTLSVANGPRTPAPSPAPSPTPTTPRLDWRMVATVTTSPGIAAAQAGLAAAQVATTAKSRPNFAVAASGTEWVEWAIAASTTPVLLSFVGAPETGTSVRVNGSDAGWTAHYPTGSTVDGNGQIKGGRRQHLLLPSDASARTVRLTVTAGASGATIYPLLHQMPASGPADSWVIVGASREDQGWSSRGMEDDIIAAFPTRDPLCFAYGKSGATASDLVTLARDAAATYGAFVSYGLAGSLIGNSYAPPYTSDTGLATLTSQQHQIVANLQAGGMKVFPASMTFRTTNSTTPAAQDNGALPYNANVINPEILADASYAYDPALLIARWDAYGFTLYNRGLLNDDRHGTPAMYDAEVNFMVDQVMRYVYTGAWGTSWSEQRVAAAETNQTVKANALALYAEATYQMAALPSSTAKSAFNARLAAIYPTVLFHDAVRLVDIAVSAVTQPTKDAAQAALNAASAAGYAGGTAPDTIAAQQARIDAVMIASVAKRAKIGFGTLTATAGWNKTNATALGVAIADLLDDTGASTGWALECTNAGTTNGSAGAQGAAAGGEFPDAILLNYLSDTGGTMAVRINGLSIGRHYNVRLIGSRTGTDSRLVNYAANGGTVQALDVINNVSNLVSFAAIVPNSSGQIEITAARGTGNAVSTYFNGLVIEELTT